MGLLPGRSCDDGADAASGLPKRITRIKPIVIVSTAHAAARAKPFARAEICKRVAVFITPYFNCKRRAAVIVSRVFVKP